MTAEQFKVLFPEFRAMHNDLIDNCYQQALLQADEDTLEEHYERYVQLLTAHLCALTPGGLNMRLEQKRETDPLTLYQAQADVIKKIKGIGARIKSIQADIRRAGFTF